ncbi:MAG: F0F1 ATP synthase subunit delta [Streptosporangiaceae bacterium]
MAGAVSRASLAEVNDRFNAVVGQADLATLGDDLLSVLHLFDREHGLRRVLSDPSRAGEDKAQLVHSLLEGKVGPVASGLAEDVVRLRWSKSGELTDAIEQLAVSAQAARAESAGQLDELEDELFRFAKIVESDAQLRNALAGQQPVERRQGLVASLLEGKVSAATLALVSEVVGYPRGRSLERGLAEYGKFVAALRNRRVALVRTAVNLTEAQRTRLAAALAAAYGHDVHLNIELDPSVLGGLAVQIGDEAIDGTIAGRLDDVRRRIA